MLPWMLPRRCTAPASLWVGLGHGLGGVCSCRRFLFFWNSHLIRVTKRKSNKPKRHHTPQLTNKMRKSIRPAIFIVAIFEPRCYWVLHELAILIELVVGVPLFLRITTTRIAVIVPQNPERAFSLSLVLHFWILQESSQASE